MLRVLAVVVTGFICVLLLLVVAAGFVTSTESGSRWLIEQIESRSNDVVSIGAVGGKLAGPLELSDVTVTSRSALISIGRVQLQWSPRALVRRLVSVKTLDVRDVRVSLIASSSPSGEPSDWTMPARIELPVDIDLQSFALTGLEFVGSPDAKPVVVDEARFRFLANTDRVEIRDLVINGELFDSSGEVGLENSNDGVIEGELQWRLRPPGLAPLEGSTLVTGQLRQPRFEQTIQPPYGSESDVTIDLATQPVGIKATLKTQTLETDRIKAGVLSVPVAINASIEGVPGALDIQADVSAETPDSIKADIAVSGLLKNDRFEVKALAVRSADVSAKLDGSGWFSITSEKEMDLNFDIADFQWPLRDTPKVELATGTVSVKGGLPTLQIATHLTVAAQPNITVTAEGTIDTRTDPAVDLVMRWSDARWPFFGDALVRSGSGSLQIDGTIDDVDISGSASIGNEGKVTAKATRKGEELTTELQWVSLAWPLVETDDSVSLLTSPAGRLSVSGQPDNYQLILSSQITALDLGRADLSVKGAGDTSSFDIATLKLDSDAGNVDANGRVDWREPWKIDLRLEGDNVDPGAFAVEWPGNLRVSLDATAQAGRNEAPDSLLETLDATVKRLVVDGDLRGYPLSIDANGSLQDGLVEIERASLSSGSTVASVIGRVDDALKLEWQLDSPSLKELLPDAQGQLGSTGRVSGTIGQPEISASLIGKQLVYSDYTVDAIDIDANWFANGKQQSDLTVKVKDAVIAGAAVQSMNLSGKGTPDLHNARLVAETDYGHIESQLSGGLGDSASTATAWAWLGSIDSLDFIYPELPPWRLRKPIVVNAAPDTVSIEQGCFDSADTALCLTASTKESAIDADVSVTNLPFEYLKTYLPEATDLSGSADGQVQLRRDAAGQLTIDANIDTSAAAFQIGSADESELSTTVFDFVPGNVKASLRDDTMSATGELKLVNDDGVAFEINIDKPLNGLSDAKMRGHVNGRIQDVGVFGALTDRIRGLRGRLVADADITGTLSNPELLGDLTLAEGGFEVPEAGVNLTDLQLQMRGDPSGDIAIEAGARIGEGDARLNGSLSLDDGLVRGNLRLQGEELAAYQTENANIWVNPDLAFTLGDRVIDVTGNIHVPRASINPVGRHASAISVSGDQEFVDSFEPQTTQPPLRVRADVDLTMGDVEVDAFGLQGKLEGELRINESHEKPTSATGELRIVDGRYDAYGQTLDIERGRIVFAGGRVTQPGIDVRALRRPEEDITVGVLAQGTLAQPDFSLFSEPPMTQRDQLSYLLLGESSEELGQSDSSAISQAEMALGLKGASFLADKIGNQFGVDTFKVETEAGGGVSTAALMIGKYLSPELYVSYGLGLFGSTSTLRAQYTLNKNWKISTESSEQGAGGDVIYSIESGE